MQKDNWWRTIILSAEHARKKLLQKAVTLQIYRPISVSITHSFTANAR